MSAVEILAWIAAWSVLTVALCKAVDLALKRTRPRTPEGPPG